MLYMRNVMVTEMDCLTVQIRQQALFGARRLSLCCRASTETWLDSSINSFHYKTHRQNHQRTFTNLLSLFQDNTKQVYQENLSQTKLLLWVESFQIDKGKFHIQDTGISFKDDGPIGFAQIYHIKEMIVTNMEFSILHHIH